MREDPGIATATIAAFLATAYGVEAGAIRYLPLGHDLAAALYAISPQAGDPLFLKVRGGPVFEPGLRVAAALRAGGIPEVLAPVLARSGAPWATFGDGRRRGILYPFVRGEDAKTAGMTLPQWRTFGAALRRVHDAGLEARFAGVLRTDAFDLPCAAGVRRALADAEAAYADPTAARLAAFLRERRGRIEAALVRAEALGDRLRARPFGRVVCHGDIHTANVLVGEDGRVHLIDWDGPLIAPRERDLFFVVGGRIARRVGPVEEAAFFAGYGHVPVDAEAIAFYRYERTLEDIDAMCRTVFDGEAGPAERAGEAALVETLVAPGADLDVAEQVDVRWATGEILPGVAGIPD